MTAALRCPRCGGTIDETGFCDDCGHRAAPAAPDPLSGGGPLSGPGGWGVSSTPAVGGTAPAVRAHPDLAWTVADLVELPVLEFADPASRISTDPHVPEQERFCGNEACRAEVGRGYRDQPALDEGYCAACGHFFSFVAALHTGDIVKGQYEILGYLARGGQGWVYLGRDKDLDDNLVVLKGMINPNRASQELATAERRALTTLNHHNIVRIFNFVADDRSHLPGGYIVMEFLNGLTLREVQLAALSGDPTGAVLPLSHVIAYGYEILTALECLHNQGLLHCDLKPHNVIRCADRIKVIDLGGVRKIGDRDAPVVHTARYHVDLAEIHTYGLTVRSDLFAAGKTLEALYGGRADAAVQAGQGPLGVAVESFQRVIRRATDRTWNRRFGTATEMAGQLKGVLREVLSLQDGVDRAVRSTLFEPSATLLDAGLGAVPDLARWTIPGDTDADLARPPAADAVAVGLPGVHTDPADPAAPALARIGAADPHSLLDKLAGLDPSSVAVPLLRCRALLELGDPPAAAAAVADAERAWIAAPWRPGDPARPGDPPPPQWRLSWHRGLVAFATADQAAARREFEEVYRLIPGEVVPKLALALCAERTGDRWRAERYFNVVWQRDRTQASAAFGLARLALTEGRAAAVEVLDTVPRISPHHDAARTAAVRLLVDTHPSAEAGPDDLIEGARRLRDLRLDNESRDRLTAVLHHGELRAHLSAARGSTGGGRNPAATEVRLRQRCEESMRRLARQAGSADEHGVLVDLANRVRPWTRW